MVLILKNKQENFVKNPPNKMINTQTQHHNYCEGVAKVADKHLK